MKLSNIIKHAHCDSQKTILINNYLSIQSLAELEIELAEPAVKKQNDGGNRIIVRKGCEFLVFRFDDIAYFFIENGLSYLVDKANHYKYITAKPLRDFETNINSKNFFRVNKKFLVHIDSVVKFRPAKRGKLLLMINPDPNEPIIISQLKAHSFKEWILQS